MAEAKRSQTNGDDEEYVSMGARLRQAREYLGISQEAVAYLKKVRAEKSKMDRMVMSDSCNCAGENSISVHWYIYLP